jgi:hypothetical protein
MFRYPQKAAFGKKLPKNKIYAFAKPTPRIKEKFVSQISEILWKFKLAPGTINLPATTELPEIEIFEISLKTKDLDEGLLEAIDKAIKFPIFYELTFESQVRYSSAYKRANESNPSKWVTGTYFSSKWLDKDEAPQMDLPLALDLKTLYEKMLRQLIPLRPRNNESIQIQVDRYCEIQRKQGELGKLEKRLRREQQFNRKVEINGKIRQISLEIENLHRQVSSKCKDEVSVCE